MFKKLILAVLLLATLATHAESWKVHPQFSGGMIKTIVDADNCVYQLVCNKLLRYDKTTGATEMLSTSNGLSDVLVKQIYYNADRRYLVIVYGNSNIDVLKADGSIVNLPALSDFVLDGDKNVNNVAFGRDNRMYVSTNFGFLVVNDETLRVEKSLNYGKPVTSLVEMGDGLAAVIGDSLYLSPTVNPTTFGTFKAAMTVKNRELSKWDDHYYNWYPYLDKEPVEIAYACLRAANDSTLLLSLGCTFDSTYVKRYDVRGDVVTMTQLLKLAKYNASNPPITIQSTPTGFLFNTMSTNKDYYTTDAAGQDFRKRTGAGAGLFSSCSTGDGALWGLGANGLFNNAAPTVYYKINGIELALPYWAAYNTNNGKLYMTNAANTALVTEASTNSAQLTAFTYDGETWRNDGCKWTSAVTAMKNSSGWQPVFDPREPNTWYVGTWFSGGVKVTNDTVVAVYDERNSTVMAPSNTKGGKYYRCLQGYGLDSQGNLWFVESDDLSKGDPEKNAVEKAAMVLPASKLALDNAVTIDDWYSYALPGTTNITSSKFSSFAIGRGDVKVYTPGNFGNNYLICWRGPIDSEPEARQHNYMIDQEGNQFDNGVSTPTMTADSTGLVWVGSSYLYYFDPTGAFDGDLHVVRPRTSTGDYTLSGVGICHIDVDHLNRKWVSTKNNGLYLINADGTEELKHFDTSNSALPSNTVYSVCPMGDTGHLMVMTSHGVVEYIDDTADAQAGGDDAVTVYPNPVRPDFTGLVTITGVKPGSMVRVTDMAGTLVAEFEATAGCAWNCCGTDGDRVETGRYAIRVQQPDGSYTTEAQAEVLVIK